MKTTTDLHTETFKSAVSNLMRSSRHITLALTVIATLTTGLWASNAAGAIPYLVKDIFNGIGNSTPTNLANINGTSFFQADDGINGRELWKSDGTTVGTVLVKDIYPGGISSSPGNLTNVNGTLFFTANDGVNGSELWKSDGTAVGTVLVKNIHTGSISSSAVSLTNVNGTLFFTANDGINGIELWKSDGTAVGTVLVKDINAGGDSTPVLLTNVSGILFFQANNGINGTELWKSNGTDVGTVLVKDIYIGANGSTPTGVSNPNLINVNGIVFFQANDGINDTELWKSDGTDVGTVLVKNINTANNNSPILLTNVNGTLFFVVYNSGWGLWKSDGTDAGTVLVKGLPGNPSFLTSVNGVLFFDGYDNTNGEELWKSDGTDVGTGMVKDIFAGFNGRHINNATNINGTLFFSADNGVNGAELWQSDGTSGGTFMVMDIRSGPESSLPGDIVEIGGLAYFQADDGVNGTELWSLRHTIVVGKNVAQTSIQAGISAAIAADINKVLVTDGMYTGVGNRNIDFGGNNITVRSENGAQETTIDCNYSGRAFVYQTGETSASVLQGFTIQNCEPPAGDALGDKGGAIYINSASPSIIDNRFIRNYASGSGGAIAIEGVSSILISGDEFIGNSSNSTGGAIYVSRTVMLTIRHSDFENNTAGSGGAVSSGAETVIDDSRFTSNRASDGGAFYSSSYEEPINTTITNSSFIDNIATKGGGAIFESTYSTISTSVISNSIFLRNHAGSNGGAMSVVNGNYEIINSSLFANTSLSGNAINFLSRDAYMVGDASASIFNSILWGNNANQSGAQIYYGNNFTAGTLNLKIGFSVLQGGVSSISLRDEVNRDYDLNIIAFEHILDIDPLFALDDNLRLMPGSPAIDAGTNTPPNGLSVTDLDGVSRSLDGNNDTEKTADIGAFEFDPANRSKLAIDSTHLRVNATINDSPPEAQVLTLRNIGGGATQWSVSEDISWLRIDTVTGTSSDSLQNIRLYIDHTSLNHDIYEGTVDIIDPVSGYLYHRLTVTLNVNQSLKVPSEYDTIQQAVDAAIDGDTVLVAGGSYTRDDSDGFVRDKNIDPRGKAITVRSEDGPETTIIDCLDSGRGFVLHRGEDRKTIIEGFTIQGGNPTNDGDPTNDNFSEYTDGGGIDTRSPVSSTFVNIRFLGNKAPLFGGGLHAAGAVSVRNCEFVANEAKDGGGLHLSAASEAEVVDSKFYSNISETGGGIKVNFGQNLRIVNSEFRKNKAQDLPVEGRTDFFNGGGIGVFASDLVSLLNNVFEGNSAQSGGGIALWGGTNEIIANSLLYRNSATGTGLAYGGGGIFSTQGTNVQIVNSTLYNNTATNKGQNILDGSNYEPLLVTNSILYLSPELLGVDIEGRVGPGDSKVSHSTISSGWTGGTAIDSLEPMFIDPDGADGIPGNSDDDFRLDPASPMIDSGLTLSSLFSDIRGSVRPVDGNTVEPGAQFDRGAYEFSEFFGGIVGDGVAKSLKNLRINGEQQVVGFEYVIRWEDKDPFPAGDPRISQAGEYDVNLALVNDAGLRIELDSFTVENSLVGYNTYFTFAPEHIGNWQLRLELAADPNQYVLSEGVSIQYKEVSPYYLGLEIEAPPEADRNQKPEVDNEAIVYWSAEINRLYAIGPGTTIVTWYADAQRENPIPVVAQLVYPTSPQIHIADTQSVTLLPAGSPFDVVQNKYSDNDASIAGNNFTATIEGWAVLLFRDGDNPDPEQREVFEVVRTYTWDHNDPDIPDDVEDPVFPLKDTAIIGKAVSDAGYDVSVCGNGYVFFEDGYYDGLGVNKAYDRATRQGPIFAINRDLTDDITSLQSPQDDLVVIWYKQSTASNVCWPEKPVRYNTQWPTIAPTIVIASQMGSGPLAPDTYGLLSNMVIYNQPDPLVLGYNPNEEHAAFFTAQGSAYPGIFPLRSDLNRPDTSEPYVLLKYREPLTNVWNMKVFKVVAGSERFRSEIGTGSIIAANANDDRYCLNSSGTVIEKAVCDAESVTYYLNADGYLTNPDMLTGCYEYNTPGSIGGSIASQSSCLTVDAIETYYLTDTGVLQLQSVPAVSEYSLDQYGVLVENDIYYRFHYNGTASSEINPPYPLNQFAFGPCTESFISPDSVQHVLRDKDEKKFAYQGEVDVKLHYFYKLQADFYYPEKTVGSCVAWLEDLDGIFVGEKPIESTYAIAWPDPVPSLFVGETLVEAKTQTGEPVSLPNIGNQCQVDVLYDQPIVDSGLYSQYSVNLIDPVTEYASVAYDVTELLDPENQLPQSLKPKKDLSTGRWVFTALPYHLQSRLTYDEVTKQVKLKGIYSVDTGEPVLLMNVLTERDISNINETMKNEDVIVRLAFLGRDSLGAETNSNAKLMNLQSQGNKGLQYPVDGYPSLKDVELKALTAGDVHGTGYVTLAFNNHADCTAPTVLSVISVGGPLYEGDIKVIESPNPFEEKVTLKHNGDFGGKTDDRAFQWMYTPADFSGVPCRPDPHVDDPASCVTRTWYSYDLVSLPAVERDRVPPIDAYPFYEGAADTVIQGSGEQLLPDKWFALRYNFENSQAVNPVGSWPPSQNNSGGPNGASISSWTAPQLYEGWIKRVMKKINLFDQKAKDFHATSANTTADMISLAGQRFEGAVALSDDPEYLQRLGIIEVYETLLERGKSLTADGGDFADINKALLFASNRLADLYMLLGNEAYADAADPTIGFSADGGVYGSEASSIYSFQNQTDSLLEEELDLLRGIDNAGIRPFYNRLVWNFTLGDGEVAYKENYNISDINADGEINEQDAMIQFPQGHGDAWGYYLSASKKYYELLKSPNFSWIPQSESILVAGTPVEVDYRDERKFANVAAARAKSGAEIVNLTYRDHYTADPTGQWQGYKDIDPSRAWGVDGWSRRAGQGAFFDWVTGNALLPAVADLAERSQTTIVENGQTVFTLPYYESNPAEPSLTLAVTHDGNALNYDVPVAFDANNQPVVTVTTPLNDGDAVTFVWKVPADSIQKIDRSTVVELWDVVGSYQSIEAEIDKADAGLNPLGLVGDVVPFDIDPAAVAAGETHFEQIYGRAVQAMNNAVAVFNHANESSQLMRRQQDTLADFQRNVANSEADYNSRLIEVFGYPYPDDCGPGKTYDTAYCDNGPDLFHYMYVDASKLMGVKAPQVHEFDVLMKTYLDVTAQGVPLADEQQVTFHVATDNRFGIIKPPEWLSARKAPGELQFARSDLLQLRGRFDKAIGEYDDLLFNIELQTQLVQDQFALNSEEIRIQTNGMYEQQTLNSSIKSAREFQLDARKTAQYLRFGAKALAEGLPTAVGFSNDLTGPIRASLLITAKIAAEIYDLSADNSIVSELGHQQAKEIASSETSIQLATDRGEFAIKQQLLQIENLVRNEATLRLELYTLAEGLQQSANRYLATLAKGDRLLRDRLRIRTQTAAQIQDYRYKDMTFRIFRNDALQKYRAQFDMASMYVYLAAKAYDYETTLLDSSTLAGQHFLTDIVKQRSIGQIENGQPLTGSGLADPMKRLWQNFQVLKPQLGFNNPQQETNRFSLRKEMMRITLETGSNDTWHQALEASRVDNLWDVPEFRRYMRPFGAEGVPEPGLVIPFSTTVTSGLNYFRWPLGGGDSYYSSSNFATKIGSVGVWFSNYNSAGLAQTPRIYLVPVGEDILRTPSYDVNDIRTWNVVDQKLPAPFPIVDTEMQNNAGWIPTVDTIYDEMFQIRRHSDFRAYHDSGFINQSEMQYDSRLIGRSVWNSKWLLIIPGRNLLYNADDGLDTFINGPEIIGGLPGERTGHGISDIKLFFETYSYSGN